MKKLFKIKDFPLSIIITFLLSTWVHTSVTMNENLPIMFKNEIGFPNQWLTIYSNESKKSVFSLLFNGNEGVGISMLDVTFDILIFYLLIIFKKMLITKIKCFTTKKRASQYDI